MTPTHEQSSEIFWRLIKDIKFCMFATKQDDGFMKANPMTTQNRGEDESDSLWFFIARNSEAATDLSQRPQVCLTYADPSSDCYVSVAGTAKIVDDHNRKQALWSPIMLAWFTGGVDDPNLALVQVHIENGHFWDIKASKMAQIFKIAKAAVTGKPVESMGTVGSLHIQ